MLLGPKGQPLTPVEVNELHRNADVDRDALAMHHTLGTRPNQAAPGNHRHIGDGTTAERGKLKPQEGDTFYDTTLARLLIYSEGGWKFFRTEPEYFAGPGTLPGPSGFSGSTVINSLTIPARSYPRYCHITARGFVLKTVATDNWEFYLYNSTIPIANMDIARDNANTSINELLSGVYQQPAGVAHTLDVYATRIAGTGTGTASVTPAYQHIHVVAYPDSSAI